MIRKNFYILLIVLLPINLFGQFEINKHMLGPSVGFSFLGSTVQFGINHEYGFSLNDLGLDEVGKIGIGGVLRYWNYSENFTYAKFEYSDFLIGLQSNYHFYIPNENVDPWIGFVFAYNFGSLKTENLINDVTLNNESNKGLWIAAHAGARYWLNNQFALNVRIGFGTLSYGALDIGIDYKFDSVD